MHHSSIVLVGLLLTLCTSIVSCSGWSTANTVHQSSIVLVGLLLTPNAHQSSLLLVGLLLTLCASLVYCSDWSTADTVCTSLLSFLVGLLLTLCAYHSSLVLVSQLLTPCAHALQHDVSVSLSVYILFLIISIGFQNSALSFFLPVPSNSTALHLHRSEVMSLSLSFPESQ